MFFFLISSADLLFISYSQCYSETIILFIFIHTSINCILLNIVILMIDLIAKDSHSSVSFRVPNWVKIISFSKIWLFFFTGFWKFFRLIQIYLTIECIRLITGSFNQTITGLLLFPGRYLSIISLFLIILCYVHRFRHFSSNKSFFYQWLRCVLIVLVTGTIQDGENGAKPAFSFVKE